MDTSEKSASGYAIDVVELEAPPANTKLRWATINEHFNQWGVETHGIAPVPLEKQTEKRLYTMFWVWLSTSINISNFTVGTTGPLFYDLSFRDSAIMFALANVIGYIIPAYFAIFGPKLGTRAMVQSRYSFGFYGSFIPSILNAFSQIGWLIFGCIVGSQILITVSDKLTPASGIVIISLITMAISLCGYRAIHMYSLIAWIPTVIMYLVLLGLGGRHLQTTTPAEYNPPASSFIGLFCVIASANLSWCTSTPDYGVHHDGKSSTIKTVLYVYAGFICGTFSGNIIGAAFASSVTSVPAWKEALGEGNDNVGELIATILAPAGGFGKFLLVASIVISSVSANAITMYTFGTSIMNLAPFFWKIPRYLYPILGVAILIPTSISGINHFYSTLLNILSIIGYWSSSFAAIILCEHFWFRKNLFRSSYNTESWDSAKDLPPGVAAVAAIIISFGIIVPSMDQAWYTGTFPKHGTGDIGMLTGFTLAGVVYIVLRMIELKVAKR